MYISKLLKGNNFTNVLKLEIGCSLKITRLQKNLFNGFPILLFIIFQIKCTCKFNILNVFILVYFDKTLLLTKITLKPIFNH